MFQISVIFTSQYFFSQGKFAKIINSNCNYLMLLDNVGDRRTISAIGSKIFGTGGSKHLLDAMSWVVKNPDFRGFSFILLDFAPRSHVVEGAVMRCRIFPW